MTDYQRGKIYKIVCNITGLTYYGSTCEPTLARRLAYHVGDFKTFKEGKRKNYMTSFKILEGGNYNIVLVELAPCNTKMELYQRERFYIEGNDCVNMNIPTRTQEEYYIANKSKFAKYYLEHKEKITAYKVKYGIENKDKLKAQRAKYYLENKEKIRLDKAKYQLENKEKIKAYLANYYVINKEARTAKLNIPIIQTHGVLFTTAQCIENF